MTEILNWGLIGGGEGSQIGFAHRIGAELDGKFRFAAGALDLDPTRSRDYGKSLGLQEDRAYGNWKEMLEAESARKDRIDLVTVATPNETHFEISKAFLEKGFHVFCEKPLTTDLEDAKTLVKTARELNRVNAVNFGYSGYPLVRQMRAAIQRGELGKIRVVFAEFAGGFFADAADADNPRVRWRFDPKQAGVSAVTADAGIHALHMACFVTGQRVSSLSADFANFVEGRVLEDDSMVSFRMDGGTVGRLWTSGLAVGRAHGLRIQVFGEKGGFRWEQEQPNQLHWTPLGEPTRILERGAEGLQPEAIRASRITVGHAEGMPLAFANLYRDLGDRIQALKEGRVPDPMSTEHPSFEDGFHTLDFVHAAVKSAREGSRWVEI
ncbi:MAG: Gfo/Idh/MocA family oxidoreductase [SAR324 cluster bacterium]|jgi:predicted dehydrogenase|nr:Gfo/Idh/MocA family oxidoreductase [SAR324 cluster bacterium]MEE1576430.1 Gfo/Idh/MocA family oxidoreductase [Deltaproteobacteria bacterium]MDP6245176.1 Gfo/Idh/MocA family oxidoreductase [SAR324 cluster bacterium]MDP6465596.1 Gfo/Idh/MocA family oxidoreductase [SAR324 cluster bacterium]MDP7138740.1 Gfo/Idh/MocA family oxidoreductase [SAR324 cluster bacterium]|tara:strand:+ start:3542 stop:4684 length:1143 start_codon:yes stop_codon:yes gene_type:complete